MKNALKEKIYQSFVLVLILSFLIPSFTSPVHANLQVAPYQWTVLDQNIEELAVDAIAIDPEEPRRIYASVQNWNIYQGNFLYQSIDHQPWELVGEKSNYGPKNMILVPSPNRRFFGWDTYGGLYTSPNGYVWSKVPGTMRLQITQLRYAKSDPTCLYMIMNETFYQSTDGGDTWIARVLPTSQNGDLQAQFMDVSATDANKVLLMTSHGRLLTLDGGLTWQYDYLPRRSSYTKNVVMMNTNDEAEIWETEKGNFRYTRDNGKYWFTLTNSIFNEHDNSARYTNIMSDPGLPNILYAQRKNSIIKSLDKGVNWITVDLGFAYASELGEFMLDPTHPEGILMIKDYKVLFGLPIQGQNQWEFAGPDAGNIRSITISASDPQHILTATAYDFFLSKDGGNNWTKRHFTPDLPTGSYNKFDLVFDPSNPQIQYVASWKALQKSVDGGETWRPLFTETTHNQKVLISLSRPNTLIVLNGHKVYRSADGGESWQLVPFNYIRDVILSATNDTLIAYTAEREIITSADFGLTWGLFSELPPNHEGTYSGKLYYQESDGVYYTNTNYGYQWATAGSSQWTNVKLQNCSWGCGPETYLIGIDQNDSNLLIIGERDKLYISHNRGETSEQLVNFPTVRQINQIVLPENIPGSVWVATSQGLFVSYDYGLTWVQKNAGISDYNATQLDFNYHSPSNLHIQSVENPSYRSVDGGQSWQYLNYFVGTDYWNFNRLFGSYAENGYPGSQSSLCSSEDGGQSWQAEDGVNYWGGIFTINPANKDIILARNSGPSVVAITYDRGANWAMDYSIYDLRFDYNQPNILYGRDLNGDVYVSYDFGQNWVCQGRYFTDADLLAGGDMERADDLFMKDHWGEFLRSQDGGRSWKELSLPYPVAANSAVAVHPRNRSVIYLGTSDNGVFKSTDGGESWLPISLGMDLNAIIDLKVSDGGFENEFGLVSPTIIYASTEFGGIYKYADDTIVADEPRFDAFLPLLAR